MTAEPAAQRSGQEFLHQAALRDPRFAGALDLSQFVLEGYRYASQIWINPVHIDFVDHGINHSFQALRKSKLILQQAVNAQEGPLSDYELAVLAVATLVHDTGMQWDKY